MSESITIQEGDPLPPLPDPPVWGCDMCFLILEVGVTYQQQVFPDKVLRIWTFCDCAYNCIADTQVITILSNRPPEFSNLSLLTASPGGVTCDELDELIGQVSAYDPPLNMPVGVQTSDSIGYDACGNKYTVYVTFKATDNEGATSTTTVPILVNDENCLPVNYCFVGSQNVAQEWIQKFSFGASSKVSGASSYSNHTVTHQGSSWRDLCYFDVTGFCRNACSGELDHLAGLEPRWLL